MMLQSLFSVTKVHWPCWLLLMLLYGCGDDVDNAAIRLGLAAGPVTLDPRYATDAASHRLNRLLYAQLVDFDEHDRPVPALASWERITLTEYRFTLADRQRRFHDGSYLTTADVQATYASVLDEKTASPHRSTLSIIESIEIIDADTLTFHLREPDTLFTSRLMLGILPARRLRQDHPFGQQPIGSGPLELAAWPAENRLVLRRKRDNQHIEILAVQGPIVRVLKLMRGELDLVQGDLPQELLSWMQQQDDIVVRTSRGSIFSYLGFNLADPVVGDHRIRLAIAHAIDRDAIIEHVLGNAARPASMLLGPDHWAGHPGLDAYDYAPDKSRLLLQQAGYTEEQPARIVYKTSNNPARIRLATIIQHQLEQVGIRVEIRSYDWGTFYADIKSGQFQMFSLSWVGLKLPDIFRYVFHSESVPPTGANRGRYQDAKVDALISAAESRTDLDEQAAIYRELQAYLHRQLPYVGLWYEDNVLAMRAGLTDYPLPTDGNYDGLATIHYAR
ncbi:MAG: ABC transporter substrate-binding protein [Gammaproteobacteria bacterium]